MTTRSSWRRCALSSTCAMTLRCFGRRNYLKGADANAIGWGDIEWLGTDGTALGGDNWASTQAFSVVLSKGQNKNSGNGEMVVLLINGSAGEQQFRLPGSSDAEWLIRFASAAQGFSPHRRPPLATARALTGLPCAAARLSAPASRGCRTEITTGTAAAAALSFPSPPKPPEGGSAIAKELYALSRCP